MDSQDYVEAVLTQANVITCNVEAGVPSAAKKVKLKNCDANDVVNSDELPYISNHEILAAINNLKSTFSDQLTDIETRVTKRFTEILKEETVKLRRDFESEITKLTDRIKNAEKGQTGEIKNVQKNFETLKSKVATMESTFSDAVKDGKTDKIICECVVRNLPVDAREANDPNVTRQLVNRVIRDGLKLSDVRAVYATRKKRPDGKPGVVLFTLETPDQKKKLLQEKKHLKHHLSEDELINRSNMQTITKELGKDTVFRFHGKRLVSSKKD